MWSNGCLRFKGKQLFKPTDKSSVIILKIMAFFVEFLSIPVRSTGRGALHAAAVNTRTA